MEYVQICAGTDGASFFDDREWPVFDGAFTPPSPAGYSVTETFPASGVLMMHHPAGYRDEWHCAPTPVLGIVLRGTIRIETSDGDSRCLSPGDRFVATDVSGVGHRMEEVSGEAFDLALSLLESVAGGRNQAGQS